MRSILLLFFLYAPAFSKGQGILIRAPQASAREFSTFLQQRKDIISFVEFTQQELQKNEKQEGQLFQLSDSLTEASAPNIPEIKTIQSQSPLTLLSLRYVRDFAEKNLALKISASERQELLHFYCKSAILLQEGPLLFPCAPVTIAMTILKKMYPQLDAIMVEYRTFSTHEVISVNENTKYQWTLLSNAQKPIRFYGTFQQLLSQRFSPENLVQGSCDDFSVSDLDFNVLNQHNIFFSETCIQAGNKNPPKKSWISENKSWIYVAATVAIGGVLYALKDKTLIFAPLR